MPATERFEGDLTDGERFWVELQPWLRDAGYELRPRYQPGWTPSWLPGGENSGRPSLLCEDGVCNPRDNVLDAVRVSDGAPVTMKAIKSVFEDEISHIQFLSAKKLRADSANHCVALLDVLHPVCAARSGATASFLARLPSRAPFPIAACARGACLLLHAALFPAPALRQGCARRVRSRTRWQCALFVELRARAPSQNAILSSTLAAVGAPSSSRRAALVCAWSVPSVPPDPRAPCQNRQDTTVKRSSTHPAAPCRALCSDRQDTRGTRIGLLDCAMRQRRNTPRTRPAGR